ncbi:MAG TPA: hypothetical protein VEQ63_05685 [Bryobacteraceae bacterium]|nr:hypothetical protein [Bryobacteraceae bacterium]
MDILGDRRFIEIPGHKQHELPPLLVHTSPFINRMDRVMNMASEIVQSEDLLGPASLNSTEQDLDCRRMDLAVNLVEQYISFLSTWHWGDGILEWIRQCETTFHVTNELRNVLKADVWPHASRASFVTLLSDKAVRKDICYEKAVGLRLTFRQPPPIGCFSNQFLFYLNSTVASTAYETWSHLAPPPVTSLPPERFTFQVVDM